MYINNVILTSAMIGCGCGYIYGYFKYIKINQNKIPFYDKNKNFPLFYSLFGFIMGGVIGKNITNI